MGSDGLEIERKYLLAGAPAAADLAALGARQSGSSRPTCASEDDWVRRVRRIEAAGGVRHVLTRKRDVAGIVREELESDLTAEEYARLLAEADPARRVIRKTRHVFPSRPLDAGARRLRRAARARPARGGARRRGGRARAPPAIAALVVREVSTEAAYTNHDAGAPAPPAEPRLTRAAARRAPSPR